MKILLKKLNNQLSEASKLLEALEETIRNNPNNIAYQISEEHLREHIEKLKTLIEGIEGKKDEIQHKVRSIS
jgi:CRISPR/Cas system CSM-associated protein Csm2 small subunit